MSLSRLALRTITVKALTGVTLAGDRVFDSSVDPIDMQAKERREPFIIVYTDEHTRQIGGRDLRHGTDTCELVIEVVVARQVRMSVPDGEELTQLEIPYTDAGLEVIIDLIHQQIMEALQAGSGPWSDLWRKFAFNITRVVSRRGASSENGLRFAARQTTVFADLLADPIRGEAMPPLWDALLDQMEADADLADLGAVIRYTINGDAPLTAESVEASRYGLSLETVDALGMAPTRDESGVAVVVEQIDAETPGAPGSPLELTEAAADEQGIGDA